MHGGKRRLLVDEGFPEQPVRQWVLSFPYPLRFLFASRPAIMGRVLGMVYRVTATYLIKKAGFGDPVVIKKILAHRKEKASPQPTNLLPSVRAAPQAKLFG